MIPCSEKDSPPQEFKTRLIKFLDLKYFSDKASDDLLTTKYT